MPDPSPAVLALGTQRAVCPRREVGAVVEPVDCVARRTLDGGRGA